MLYFFNIIICLQHMIIVYYTYCNKLNQLIHILVVHEHNQIRCESFVSKHFYYSVNKLSYHYILELSRVYHIQGFEENIKF